MKKFKTCIAVLAVTLAPCASFGQAYRWEAENPAAPSGNGYSSTGENTPTVTYRFFPRDVDKTGGFIGEQMNFPEDSRGPENLTFKLVGPDDGKWYDITVDAYYQGWFYLKKGFLSGGTVGAFGDVDVKWLHKGFSTDFPDIPGQNITITDDKTGPNKHGEHEYVNLGSTSLTSEPAFAFQAGDEIMITPKISNWVALRGSFQSTGAADMGALDAGQGLFVTLSAKVSPLAPPVPEPAEYGLLSAGLGLLGYAARRKGGQERISALA